MCSHDVADLANGYRYRAMMPMPGWWPSRNLSPPSAYDSCVFLEVGRERDTRPF
jgi:hypothetical protein